MSINKVENNLALQRDPQAAALQKRLDEVAAQKKQEQEIAAKNATESNAAEPKDEYIAGTKEAETGNKLYYPERGEAGKPAAKADQSSKQATEESKGKGDEKTEQVCTAKLKCHEDHKHIKSCYQFTNGVKRSAAAGAAVDTSI